MFTDRAPGVSSDIYLFTAVLAAALFLEISLQHFWIARMRSMRIKQVTKLYGPSWHEKTKTGTPTMGGVTFFPVLLLSLSAVWAVKPELDFNYLAAILSYPLLAATVGFIDDWVKHKKQSSDGLSSLQKLVLQILCTAPWAAFVLTESLSLIPGAVISRGAAIALLTFTGVGFQNAVNVTDGLDGLAAGCALFSFFAAAVFLRGDAVILAAAAAACGVCLGFLWHNANPASVFMGDAGAHFLAGLLLALCVLPGYFIFIVPFGFIFGVELISVAVQIMAIRLFKKKVFCMSPLHHHFEMLGWSEQQIVTRFWIVHIAGMLTLLFALSRFFDLA